MAGLLPFGCLRDPACWLRLLRLVLACGTGFPAGRDDSLEGCPTSIWPTLAFFHCAIMIIMAAGIQRTVRKAPAYAE